MLGIVEGGCTRWESRQDVAPALRKISLVEGRIILEAYPVTQYQLNGIGLAISLGPFLYCPPYSVAAALPLLNFGLLPFIMILGKC